MAFADKPWSERYTELGDLAEGKFRLFADSQGIKWYDSGIHRPPFTHRGLPLFIRSLPDFLCYNSSHFWVECKGSGGRVVKIKLESMEALKQWNNELTVWFFIYNSKNDSYSFINYRQLLDICETCSIMEFSNDHKQYYHVPCSKLEWHNIGETNA